MSGPAEMVAELAGLDDAPPPGGGPLTPQALIDTYCRPEMQSGWRTKRRKHSTFHAGFCGFDGHKGYDDGYSWMTDLTRSGWVQLPDIGDWPLVAFMLWHAKPSDPRYSIAHYCEGDTAIEVFDSKHAVVQVLQALRRKHRA
jgi:hypothetical protein